MIEDYKSQIAKVCSAVIGQDIDIELSRPEEGFGDLTTNVAMKLAKARGKNPHKLASQIAKNLEDIQDVSSAVVAGPGFINITLTDQAILKSTLDASKINKTLAGQQIVAEYSDPNPFKILHAGHLYSSLVGDGIANLLETAGAEVHRVNFGGDVGLHVAKTMWAILGQLGGEHPDKLAKITDKDKLKWLSDRYVEGNQAYENNQSAKPQIISINKRVYKLHEDQDNTSPFAQIYWTCRQWSYDSFDALYARLQMQPFEKYYPESAVSGRGLSTVNEGLKKGIFKESDGAVIFEGSSQDIHTRVFINSEGLPTYEAKDLGLALTKWDDYHFDKSLIITGNEIAQYMQVVLAALKHFEPKATKRTIHRTHGQIKLAGGVKMSSRRGNILTADDVLDAAFAASQKQGNQDEDVVLGAVRYSFLKTRLGGDIIYNPQESVGLEGNSGPYIQYALVRARSIIKKADKTEAKDADNLEPAERSLARNIGLYPEVFETALSSYSPHYICNYLYELAQSFNRFYETNRVIDDPRAGERLALVKAYEQVLSNGLDVLGMPKPEKM